MTAPYTTIATGPRTDTGQPTFVTGPKPVPAGTEFGDDVRTVAASRWPGYGVQSQVCRLAGPTP